MSDTISSEQRAWLKDLGKLVGAPVGVETSEDEVGEGEGGDAPVGRHKGDTVRLGLFPGVLDAITTRVTIKNKTAAVLKIVAGSSTLENKSASYPKAPPIEIPANGEGDFSVTNNVQFSPVSLGGTGGEIKYELVGDEKKVVAFMKWERGGIAPSRTTQQNVTPDDGRFKIDGVNSGEDFQFDLVQKGGTGPGPGPNPGPGPGPGPNPGPAPVANVPASCLISVTNDTAFELTRAQADHDRGDFAVPPPRSVEPNSVVTFNSVETPGAQEQGCKGFVVWQVGSPEPVVWRVEWDNPENQKNTSAATLTPQTAGFASQDIIGQGEDNVPVQFALSGGPAGPGPGPGPKPGPEPKKEVPFEPPVEARQPTLRKGDKSPDGWVEYAQLLLNFHLKTKLAEDGDFGPGTLAAVLRFQRENKLLVDGVIGNQTWAALREGAPEKPSTDGRKPHSYVEQGAEARWVRESPGNNRYDRSSDTLRLAAQTVGDTPIDAATEATVRITAPGAAPKTVKVPLGAASKNATGYTHEIAMAGFRKDFPSVPADAPVTGYRVEAYLPQELGGDLYTGNARE